MARKPRAQPHGSPVPAVIPAPPPEPSPEAPPEPRIFRPEPPPDPVPPPEPPPPVREDWRGRATTSEHEARHWRDRHAALAHEHDGQRDEIDRLKARLAATGPSADLVAKIRKEERARIANIVAHVLDPYPNEFSRRVKAELLKWLNT